MHAARWAMLLALVGVAGGVGTAAAQGTQAVPGRKATPAAASRPAIAAKPKEARRPSARRPATLPASVNAAVRELAKEFEVGKLRQKSDYFVESTSADLTPQVITQLLNRPLGESGSMDAYIKWQLLSAMPKEAPAEVADAALEAYRNAPALQRRPGIDPAERRALDRELRKAEDPADITTQLDEEVRRTDTLNRSVTAYRDALFACLPDGIPVYEMALNDVYERCMAGISPRSLTELLGGRASRWVGRDATDAQARQLAGMIRKLMAQEIPDYYEGVRRGELDRRYTWLTGRADPNVNGRLQDILAAMDRGGGGMGPQGEVRPAGRRGR